MALILSTPPGSCRCYEMDPSLFEAPRGYSVIGTHPEPLRGEDDDDLLQFAIQQSLLEAGSEYDQVGLSIPPLFPETGAIGLGGSVILHAEESLGDPPLLASQKTSRSLAGGESFV